MLLSMFVSSWCNMCARFSVQLTYGRPVESFYPGSHYHPQTVMSQGPTRPLLPVSSPPIMCIPKRPWLQTLDDFTVACILYLQNSDHISCGLLSILIV